MVINFYEYRKRIRCRLVLREINKKMGMPIKYKKYNNMQKKESDFMKNYMKKMVNKMNAWEERVVAKLKAGDKITNYIFKGAMLVMAVEVITCFGFVFDLI